MALALNQLRQSDPAMGGTPMKPTFTLPVRPQRRPLDRSAAINKLLAEGQITPEQAAIMMQQEMGPQGNVSTAMPVKPTKRKTPTQQV